MRRTPSFWRSLLLALATAAAPASWGQAALTEWDLKAALVFNFARYVEWPERAFASREAPLVLCLVGRDHSNGAFAALDGRKLQGRSLRLRAAVAADDARSCHVVFISDPVERQMGTVLRNLAAQPVLTVSDVEGFIDLGGAIGIVPGEQRLQFEVNRNALDQAQLKASSQLLKLARAVLGQGS